MINNIPSYYHVNIIGIDGSIHVFDYDEHK